MTDNLDNPFHKPLPTIKWNGIVKFKTDPDNRKEWNGCRFADLRDRVYNMSDRNYHLVGYILCLTKIDGQWELTEENGRGDQTSVEWMDFPNLKEAVRYAKSLYQHGNHMDRRSDIAPVTMDEHDLNDSRYPVCSTTYCRTCMV